MKWEVATNRTILELKWAKICQFDLSQVTTNRTILELKLAKVKYSTGTDPDQSHHTGIEIFPENGRQRWCRPTNRTILELK